MGLWTVPAVDLRPDLVRERADLLALLDGLTTREWHAPTAAPGWTVKDIALHLLDDDLGWLSRDRDGDRAGLLDPSEYSTFVGALAAKNEAWIRGAQQLSAPVIGGLLRWTATEMDRYYASMDLMGEGFVVWASDEPVPLWFDIAQDLTERWVHQMQMREAVDKVGDYAAAYLPAVLTTFVWAFPHQYRADAPAGTQIGLDLAAGGTWTLACDGRCRWALTAGAPVRPSASIRASDEAGWRWLTGADTPAGGISWDGLDDLVRPLLDVRGIIV